jgi:hypothetical protein
VVEGIRDVVYVRPESFEARQTPKIAAELEGVNAALVAAGRPYLLIGFGRWGSSDPWLGTPVQWPQICGAKVIVEATRPDMDVDPSQGAHFFHNLTSFRVCYFSVPHAGAHRIDWAWLERQERVSETALLRHVRPAEALQVRVDGRHGRGVILRPADRGAGEASDG